MMGEQEITHPIRKSHFPVSLPPWRKKVGPWSWSILTDSHWILVLLDNSEMFQAGNINKFKLVNPKTMETGMICTLRVFSVYWSVLWLRFSPTNRSSAHQQILVSEQQRWADRAGRRTRRQPRQFLNWNNHLATLISLSNTFTTPSSPYNFCR